MKACASAVARRGANDDVGCLERLQKVSAERTQKRAPESPRARPTSSPRGRPGSFVMGVHALVEAHSDRGDMHWAAFWWGTF